MARRQSRYVDFSQMFNDSGSSSEEETSHISVTTHRTPSTQHIRIENERRLLTPKSSVILPSDLVFDTPSAVRNTDGIRPITSTPSTSGSKYMTKKQMNKTSERKRAASNIYNLLPTSYDLNETFNHKSNQDVTYEFQKRLIQVLNFTEEESRSVAYKKFRTIKQQSTRSAATKTSISKTSRKHNKLKRRLIRLKTIMPLEDVEKLDLSSELMSSEDECGIVHVPRWRTEAATRLFIKADNVQIKRARSFSRFEGRDSVRPLPESLLNHSMTIK